MATVLNDNTREVRVKRLLRRQNTSEYYAEGGWTDNPEQARTFSDVVEAAETCARLGLNDVELTLRVKSSDLFCTPLR
jgi:hypothetical protein